MKQNSMYDVIVIGAGHAGCEAAHAAATMGSKVLLVTMNMETIAKMSCNPAMGGVAKGQIIREIDALGGMSGIITDKTMIQFRMLNKSKGIAMWSPRAQSDRMRFSEEWRLALEQNFNIDFFQDSVNELVIENNKVTGVVTSMGNKFLGKTVVLTAGTFLNGIIHIGTKQFGGGRMAEKSAFGITAQLEQLGFTAGRMKTGTPPRVDGRSLDYSLMEEQHGDDHPSKFSYLPNTSNLRQQKSCFITYTNSNVHDILRTGFEESPMYNGSIQGLGPRYCPSIEDKINRFAERDRHQLFIEPEGWNTIEIYVNGFSTSLPDHIQTKALKEVPGFSNVKLFRPGYAIEYDFFQPTQLNPSLETKNIENLFFAGQINGTTGYEEAAAQGLMAGINAHLKVKNLEPLVLGRDQAYIGVLIDDLVHKGTDEPYRMFTSRAEYRISLRQDNADQRLTAIGLRIGLAEQQRDQLLNTKQINIADTIDYLNTNNIDILQQKDVLNQPDVQIHEKIKLSKFLLRPEVSLSKIMEVCDIDVLKEKSEEVILQAEVLIKYKTYLEREIEQALKIKKLEHLKIPENYNFMDLKAMSMESREKLNKIQPKTIAQASQISGVSPSDISVLLIHFGR
jgi:tRNA uridine 5-carboxymethylaminomethyl modification enzyme